MPNTKDAHFRHASYFEKVLRNVRKLYLHGNESVDLALSLIALEWNNIEVGQAWSAANLAQDQKAARLCSDYADAGAYVLEWREHPSKRIRWREAALEAARRLKLPSAESAHLSDLGLAYTDLGEMTKAVQCFEQCLKILLAIGNRQGEGNALINIGNIYFSLGETRRSIEFHEKALVINGGKGSH